MNSDMLWSEFLALVREEAGIRVLETWFRALTLQYWDTSLRKVYIQAPNAFIRDWVTTNFQGMIDRIFARLLHSSEVEVAIVLVDEPLQKPGGMARDVVLHQLSESLNIVPAVRDSTRMTAVTGRRARTQHAVLQHAYRFDTFIVGTHNELAYTSAHAIVERPGKIYNPFFVYGKSGAGKTHLLHAMGNALRERSKDSRIVYQNTNRFVADFIHAVRFGRVAQFEANYKNIDLLLMDDIQFLAHKEQTQTAFFHLFNNLHHEQRQIVCTSDSLPENMAGCSHRIRSRLASGLIADISDPPHDTKVEIIKRKAEQQGLVLYDEVASSIVQHGGDTVRDLEGSLIRVSAYAAFKKAAITVGLVREALNRSSRSEKPELDMGRVATVVSRYFNYSLEQLRAKDRTRGLVYARHIIILLIKRLTNHSLREIGTYLRYRDHSTVVHAIGKIEQLCAQDEQTQKLVTMFEQQLVDR